jgi:O-antigen ligase
MEWNKILKFLIISGVVALLYTPFIVSSSMFFPYITGKAYYFRIITEIVFFLWIILAVLDKNYRPKLGFIFYAFLAFVISLFFSNLLGENPTASFWSNYERMEGWVTIVHLFALFLTISSTFTKKENWSLLFNASLIFGWFMVFSGLGQIMEHATTPRGYLNPWGYRIDTTLGNSTYVGIYMLMNAFLSLFLIFSNPDTLVSFLKKVKKTNFNNIKIWFYIISFATFSWGIFQTGTRGSMLGWFGGLILAGILMAILNKNKTARASAFSIIGFASVFIIGLFILKDTALVQNIQPLKRITSISISEGTAQARIINWKIATEGFKERPILGWGQSNFNYVFDKYYLPEHYGNETWFDRVHNIFFDWLIAGGIIGLILYLSIWLSTIITLFKSDKISANEKSIMVALLAAYFFHNLFVFDQIVSYIYFIFFLSFAGYALNKPLVKSESNLSDTTKMILVSIAIILLPITIYAVNSPSYKANKELIEAMTIVKRNDQGNTVYNFENGLIGNMEKFQSALERDTFANPEIRQRILLLVGSVSRINNLDPQFLNMYIDFVISEMNKQIEQDPLNSRHYYTMGTLYRTISQQEEAEEYLLKAIELSPNKQAMRMPLINHYNLTEQSEKAISLAKETYELDKSKYDLWKLYVETLNRFDDEMFIEFMDQTIEEGKGEWIEKMTLDSIAENPNNYQNYISLSAYYMRSDQVDRSLETLNSAKEEFPEIATQVDSLITQIENGENPLGATFTQ